MEELPNNHKWIEAIAASIVNLNNTLQSELHTLSNINAMDTSDVESKNLSHIWAKLDVLPSLVLRDKTPKQLERALADLMHTLISYCNETGFQHTYVALVGKALSVSSTLGLDVDVKEIWDFLQSALPAVGGMIPLLRGANAFMRAYEEFVIAHQDQNLC